MGKKVTIANLSFTSTVLRSQRSGTEGLLDETVLKPEQHLSMDTSASSWRKDVYSFRHEQATEGEPRHHQVMRIIQRLLFWCKDRLNRSHFWLSHPCCLGRPEDATDLNLLSGMLWNLPQLCTAVTTNATVQGRYSHCISFSHSVSSLFPSNYLSDPCIMFDPCSSPVPVSPSPTSKLR